MYHYLTNYGEIELSSNVLRETVEKGCCKVLQFWQCGVKSSDFGLKPLRRCWNLITACCHCWSSTLVDGRLWIFFPAFAAKLLFPAGNFLYYISMSALKISNPNYYVEIILCLRMLKILSAAAWEYKTSTTTWICVWAPYVQLYNNAKEWLLLTSISLIMHTIGIIAIHCIC